MVDGDSVPFSSTVTAQGASSLVPADSASVFAGSVLDAGSDGLIAVQSAQLVAASVGMGSGSVGLVSDSLFVAGSDAGSEALGFVISSAKAPFSGNLGSEFSGVAAKVAVSDLTAEGLGSGSDSAVVGVPVSCLGSGSDSAKVSASCLVSTASAPVSTAMSSVFLGSEISDLAVKDVVSGLPVGGLGSGSDSTVVEVPAVSGQVTGLISDASGPVSAALRSVLSDSTVQTSDASVLPSGQVSTVGSDVEGSAEILNSVQIVSAGTVKVSLGLDAVSGLDSEKSSGSAAVGLSSSVAELNGSVLQSGDTGVVSKQSFAHGQGVEIPKKSYLSAVQQKSSLSKHILSVVSEDGVQVVQVPDDILTNVQHLWDDLIIGKFPDDSPHIAKVHVIVNKIWAYGNKLSRIDAFVVNKSTIKFRIKDPIIRDRVLRRGMWNIADKPMIVSKYGPIDEEDSAPRSMSLWVTLKQIPPSYYSWKGLSFLSSVVGEPKRLHPETELCNKFDEAKVFIEVDLTKPLPDSFSFKSRNGVVSEVKYSYPWLPPRCCACGKWGHLIDVCRTVTILKRNTQVLDPPHPVGIATDAGGGVATPLSVTVTKSGNTHPTKDLTAVSAVTKTISDTGNQPPAGFPPPPTNQLSPALSHPVCQASDVGGSGGTPLSVTREIQGENMDKEGWSLVSPKKSHHGQKVTPEVLKLGSPSRYSVLVGQDELDTPAIFDKPSAVVPREVHTENKIIVATGHQQLGGKKNETIIRPSLPRQSKTARKNNSTASNLSRKGEVTKKNSN